MWLNFAVEQRKEYSFVSRRSSRGKFCGKSRESLENTGKICEHPCVENFDSIPQKSTDGFFFPIFHTGCGKPNVCFVENLVDNVDIFFSLLL